jgi:hypothetical protein
LWSWRKGPLRGNDAAGIQKSEEIPSDESGDFAAPRQFFTFPGVSSFLRISGFGFRHFM